MRVWMYERGEWKWIPDPFKEGATLERTLEAFELEDTPALLLGDPDAFHVEAYTPAGTEVMVLDAPGGAVLEAEFLVVVNTWARWYPVFVADLPSLVQLMGELRPMLASEREALDFQTKDERED